MLGGLELCQVRTSVEEIISIFCCVVLLFLLFDLVLLIFQDYYYILCYTLLYNILLLLLFIFSVRVCHVQICFASLFSPFFDSRSHKIVQTYATNQTELFIHAGFCSLVQ